MELVRSQHWLTIATADELRAALLTDDYLAHGPKPQKATPTADDTQWLVETFSHWSAPVIDDGRGWRTIPKTLSEEEFLQRFGSPLSTIALRFGAETSHCVFDIDYGSSIHPRNGLEKFNELLAVLEEHGLCSPVVHRSSDSMGIHVRYFFPQKRNTYLVALALKDIVASAGFVEGNGELELFPNVKAWVNIGRRYEKGQKHHDLHDYKAVRVPCQKGYELLDSLTLEPVGDNSLGELRQRALWAASNQDLQTFDECLERVKAPALSEDMLWEIAAMETHDFHGSSPESYIKTQSRSPKVVAMETDYRALVERGWQAHHETNDILGSIARLTRILTPCPDGELAATVEAVVTGMPGYAQHCRHQHEISRRCKDWARCVIRHGYHYYKGKPTRRAAQPPKRNINLERQNKAIKGIRKCLGGFIRSGQQFASKSQVVRAIAKQTGSSKSTILKHWQKFINLASVLLGKDKTKTNSNPAAATVSGDTAQSGTHPHCTNNKAFYTLGDSLPPPWEPSPPPPKLPTTFIEFQDFAQQLPEPTEAHEFSLSDIPKIINQAVREFLRVDYASSIEELERIAGELNRCAFSDILKILRWLKSLASAEQVLKLPSSTLTPEERAEAKRLRKHRSFQKFREVRA